MSSSSGAKIRYVGSSNFPGWGIAQANERAARRGTFGLVCQQGLYNLTAGTGELELAPACQQHVGLIPARDGPARRDPAQGEGWPLR